MLKDVWKNLQMQLSPAWQRPEVAALYAIAANQARLPQFYIQGGVPDSLDGRFDLLALHLVLVLRRLDGQGKPAMLLRQRLFDLFAADMDRNLREMGVGDTGISRRVKTMGQAFYGRLKVYDEAFSVPVEQRQAALMTALDKNLYGTVPTVPVALGAMARYMLATMAYLLQQPVSAILAGQLDFLPPQLDDHGR